MKGSVDRMKGCVDCYLHCDFGVPLDDDTVELIIRVGVPVLQLPVQTTVVKSHH